MNPIWDLSDDEIAARIVQRVGTSLVNAKHTVEHARDDCAPCADWIEETIG